MQQKFMTFNFGKIHYKQLSSGKKITLILLPATCSSAESFSEMNHLLAPYFNLISLDFPGHGLSDSIDLSKDASCYSVSGLVPVLVEFIKKLDLKNIILVGNSLGANVAIRSLPFFKDLLTGLVLEGSFHGETKEEFFKASTQIIPRSLMVKQLLNEDEVETLALAYLSKSHHSAYSLQKMIEDIKKTDKAFREQLILHIETLDWPDELQMMKNSNLPLLYIGGEEDAFIKPAFYSKLIEQHVLRESRLHLLPKVGHVPHLENPTLCAKLILEFSEQPDVKALIR